MIYEILKVGRSTDSLDDPIFDNFSYYAEEKVDGVGAMMVWDDDGHLMALTPKRDVTECFPEEFQHLPSMAGWILPVEVVAGRTSSDVATFLSAKGWKSAKDPGIVVLDTLRDGDGDVRGRPFIRRRSLSDLAAVELRLVAPVGFTVRTPDWSLMTKRELAERIVADGGEGVVLKDVNEPYSDACNWVKFKAVRTVDCAVRFYVDGNGKYEGGLGALILELRYKGVEWVQVGTCSGMTDEQRTNLKKRLDAKRSFVAEVKFQCWTSKGKLRHPRFVRVRRDKKLADCTWTEQGPGGRS